MPLIDEAAGEINVKITYHGTTLGGRTTNLQHIYNKTRPELKHRMVSVATETARSLYFDFRPLALGDVGGLAPRIHLSCSPGCEYIEGAKEQVLADADGVVFVVDSQAERTEANIAALEQLEACIARQGRALVSLPLTVQYNKRDLPNARSIGALAADCNPYHRPSFAATATTGVGVFETLKDIVRQVLGRLRAPGGG